MHDVPAKTSACMRGKFLQLRKWPLRQICTRIMWNRQRTVYKEATKLNNNSLDKKRGKVSNCVKVYPVVLCLWYRKYVCNK